MATAMLQPQKFEATFGQGLRRIRLQEGLKQETLARLAGYTDHTNIVKIEGGKTLPSLDKALALAQVLKVPIEAFIWPDYMQHGLWRTLYELNEAPEAERPTAARLMIRILRAFADDLENRYVA